MRRPRILAITLASALLASACSDESRDGSPAPRQAESGLIAALGKVRATDSTRRYVEYGDVAKAWSLYNADSSRFYVVTAYGIRTLTIASELVSEKLGFDPLAMREAITAGQPPDWSAIAWGDYDVDAVNRRFGELGIKRIEGSGSSTWIADTDGVIPPAWPVAETMQPDMLDNVRTAPGWFAYSPKLDSLDWVTDPGVDTLAKDPTTRALAECLGDVVTAAITKAAATETVAIGVRAPSTTDFTEVVCVAPGTESIRDHATNQLANGRNPRTDLAWSDLLPNNTVELIDGSNRVVRVTSRPKGDNPPNRFEQILREGELDELLGLHA